MILDEIQNLIRDRPTIGTDEIHVWILELPPQVPSLQSLFPLLDEQERARATAFVNAHDACRYILTHVSLRTLLSGALGCSPTDIRYRLNKFGKPAPQPLASSTTQLEFSVSHSGELAAIGISVSRPVGIDIEAINPDNEVGADRYFSIQERNALSTIIPSERTRAFFACWTRKEAFVKALGVGLSYPLERFSVGVDPDIRRALVHSETAEQWEFDTLDLRAGYAGAVVAQKGAWNIVMHTPGAFHQGTEAGAKRKT